MKLATVDDTVVSRSTCRQNEYHLQPECLNSQPHKAELAFIHLVNYSFITCFLVSPCPKTVDEFVELGS
jgi:hypothetical protein